MEPTPIYIITLIISVFVIPLISFFINIALPNNIEKLKAYLSTLLLLISTILSFMLLMSFFSTWSKEMLAFSTALKAGIGLNWISLPDLKISFGILYDRMAVIMLLVVSLISLLVHIFSLEYMKGDKRFSRYYAYLGLFTFSMNGIVLSNNLFFTFVFWELVGLSSFLLIGFWYEKNSAGNAAKKAFLVNRVGDIGMFLGIMLILVHCNTLIYSQITNQAFFVDSGVMTIAGLLIFMGAVGKSAQFPLHVWLPDAMEGPTPVSALIHAATMVAAGVYMSLRIFPFLTTDALFIIAIIGAITAIVASLIATSQYDIKKVLAYSTVSQLGYMVCAIGVGAYFSAFFHLITHAMFKACLFLCSGSVIHGMHHAQDHIHDHSKDPQDIRNMGGLRNKMPITYYAMLLSTLSLCGFPLFSGFLSKDSIVSAALSYYHHFHGITIVIPILIIASALLTSFYMFRLIFLVFFGENREKSIFNHIKESSYKITLPLIVLSVLSLANVFNFPNINPISAHGWFENLILSESPYFTLGYDMQEVYDGIHHSHKEAMVYSLIMAFLGLFIAYMKYYRKVDIFSISKKPLYQKIRLLFKNKFYIDEFYQSFIVIPFLNFSKRASILDWDFYDQIFIDFWGWITIKFSKLSAVLDYSFLDQMVVDGFAKITNKSGKEMQSSQNGILQTYLMSGVVGLIILIIIIQQLG